MPIVALAFAALGAVAVAAYRASRRSRRAVLSRGARRLCAPRAAVRPGPKDGGEIGEAEWRAFLDAEVTPRFPDGLTVLTGYGQWRNSAGAIAKETSRVLVIWHRPGAGSDAKIEAIRAAYKAQLRPGERDARG